MVGDFFYFAVKLRGSYNLSAPRLVFSEEG